MNNYSFTTHKNHKKTTWHDRFDAGRDLAQEVAKRSYKNALLLAIPRGGVEVGYQMAIDLGLTLSVLGVRKIGAPHSPELAIGALSENSIVLNYALIDKLEVSEEEVNARVRQEQQELDRHVRTYRNNDPIHFMTNMTVILVDDGIATGMTGEAAISSIKIFHPKKIVYAAPVAAPDAFSAISHLADDAIVLATPPDFTAVGNYYDTFSQVTDKTVRQLLEKLRPQ